MENGFLKIILSVQIKARKNGIQHGKCYITKILSTIQAFFTLKFKPKRKQKIKDSLDRKNSSLTSYCLTVINNLTKHWYIQVSCTYSITQG